MAHRVRLSAATQRISAAGVDVLSATEDQLLLDGNGAPYNGCLLSGIALASSFTETTESLANPGGSTGTRYTRVCTVSFGRDLGYVPRAVVGVLDPSDSAKPFTTNYLCSDIGRGGGSSYNTGSIVTMNYTLTSSALTITVVYLHYDGAGWTRTVDCPYLVFQT